MDESGAGPPRTQSHSHSKASAGPSVVHTNQENQENQEKDTSTSRLQPAGPDPPDPPPDKSALFIKNAQNFARALRRLYTHNDAIIFWNATRDLKLMIRADVSEEDDDMMAFDFVLIYDEESDRSGTRFEMMDLEHDGYYDADEDLFFIDELRMPKHPLFDNDDLLKSIELINKFYMTKVCPCSKYMIKNGETSCTYCLLTADAKDSMEFSCPICLDTIFGCHAVCQPCCSTHLHRNCLDTWSNQSMDSARRCPLCRAG